MVWYNGEQVWTRNLPEGNYFIRLESHVEGFNIGPPIPRDEIAGEMVERGWPSSQTIAEDASLPGKNFYEGIKFS